MDTYKGQVALITGASSGIGTAVAEALHGVGMRVALVARRQERLDALCARLGEGAGAFIADLRDADRIPELFEHVRESFGGVDVLVNNAGLGHQSPLMSGDTAMWREMLDVNVLALCVCTREAIQDMQRRERAGHIIHISSMAAHRVPRGSGVYSASKHAVKALTEALRMELRQAGSDIRVTSVSPGYVETEFAEKYHRSAKTAQQTYSRFPVLQADDVAQSVLHALSMPAHAQIHDILMRPTHQPS